jgi:hypothetical protein
MWGNIIQLRLSVRTTSSTASGGNIYEGELIADGVTDVLPMMTTTSGTYYGSYAIGATLSTNGNIVIRNSDSRSFAATGTTTLNISFTYIVPNGYIDQDT